MHKQLKILRITLGLSQQKMAILCGADQGNYSRYERGVRVPLTTFIIDVCKQTNVNANWLLLGKEEMFMAQESH